jgi:hypothetical protein
MADKSDGQKHPPQVPGMWAYRAAISGDGPGTPRMRAISVVLAAQAGMLGEVSKFREEYLEGKLLPADQVLQWVTKQPENALPPVWYLSDVPLDRLTAVADGSYIIPRDVVAEVSKNTRLLFFATPKYEAAHEAIHKTGGVLDTLRNVARELVEFYTPVAPADEHVPSLWKPEHAVTFILTGYVPLVTEQQYYGLPSRPGRRQTAKTLELAAFVAVRDAEGVTPEEQFSEWNSLFPAWAYKDLPHFAYDGRESLRRLEDVDELPTLPVHEHTAEELVAAHAEQQRQTGRRIAVWGSDIDRLLEDAKQRDKEAKRQGKE